MGGSESESSSSDSDVDMSEDGMRQKAIKDMKELADSDAEEQS